MFIFALVPFFFSYNHFSKARTSNYLLYILFYLNNHYSFFIYYYLHKEKERKREEFDETRGERKKIIYNSTITVVRTQFVTTPK